MEIDSTGTALSLPSVFRPAKGQACGTRTVIGSSFLPTRKYCFYRMYSYSDLSFSRDAQEFLEEKENEGHYCG
jgi:hypothetical protein